MQEKDVLEQVILEGVGKLKGSINTLHRRMVKGTTASDRIREEDDEGNTDSLEELGRVRIEDLLKDLADIEVEAKQLQKRNEDLQRYDNQCTYKVSFCYKMDGTISKCK